MRLQIQLILTLEDIISESDLNNKVIKKFGDLILHTDKRAFKLVLL